MDRISSILTQCFYSEISAVKNAVSYFFYKVSIEELCQYWYRFNGTGIGGIVRNGMAGNVPVGKTHTVQVNERIC